MEVTHTIKTSKKLVRQIVQEYLAKRELCTKWVPLAYNRSITATT